MGTKHGEFVPVGKRMSKIELRNTARLATDIHNEYCRRKKSVFAEDKERFPHGMPPSENATNFLKREIYRLALLYRENGYVSWLDKEARSIREWGIIKGKSAKSIFNLAFLCVFADDRKWVVSNIQDNNLETNAKIYNRLFAVRAGISAQDRELFVKQLEYADRHNVPAGLLCGFLLQSGSPRLIRNKLKDKKYREPAWKYNRIVNEPRGT